MRRTSSVALAVLLVAAALVVLAPTPPATAAGSISVYLAGLNWPTALAFASDGRIFYAERFTGSIRIIAGGTLLPAPFYTLADTATGGERGLLGLALDPGFPSSPYVYAYQTYNDVANSTVYNRIVRIVGGGDTGISHSVILQMPPLTAGPYHNGGVIAFGPDGKLYAVVGENGIPSLSQDPMSPMGKVLRMNPDGTAPLDNPYYGNPAWDSLVFTYGHRNMFGLAFHPDTGRVYVTENGPACNDEVSVLTPGGNFGWGPTATCSTPPPAPNNTNRDGPSPILPIWWWTPTICPTNAAVYGGPFFPAWRGDLFVGDCNFPHRLHRLDLGPPGYDSVASDTILWTAPRLILEVEEGPDGAIWVTTDTTIYRYWDSAQRPVAAFTASPNPASVGVPVTFDASGSFDPDGTIVSYMWDFGDSTAGSGGVTSHAYAATGTYNATLTVVDNESYTDTAYRDVVVETPPPGPRPPVASFVATPSPATTGTRVTFDGSASYDPDGTVVLYAWNFGDGLNGAGVLVEHAYSMRGTFTVTLSVEDDLGLSNSTSLALEVQNGAPRIVLSTPGLGPVTAQVGSTRTFTVEGWDPDGDSLTYAWTIDGVPAGGNASTLELSAARAGTFIVNVTVSDGSLEDWRQWSVTVDGLGWAMFTSGLWWIVLVAAVLGALLLWRITSRRPPGP